jgi:hypothetical protein
MVLDGRDPDQLWYHDGLQAALFPSWPAGAIPIVDQAELSGLSPDSVGRQQRVDDAGGAGGVGFVSGDEAEVDVGLHDAHEHVRQIGGGNGAVQMAVAPVSLRRS